jgi:hypothetical protein
MSRTPGMRRLDQALRERSRFPHQAVEPLARLPSMIPHARLLPAQAGQGKRPAPAPRAQPSRRAAYSRRARMGRRTSEGAPRWTSVVQDGRHRMTVPLGHGL